VRHRKNRHAGKKNNDVAERKKRQDELLEGPLRGNDDAASRIIAGAPNAFSAVSPKQLMKIAT
jgi:hypothetical protein